MAVSLRCARVVSVGKLSPSVCILRLELDDPSFSFVAGQWLNLHVPTPNGIEKRAYSIASGPLVRPVELAITHVAGGVVSPVLHGLMPGAEIACDGPHGFFTREGAARATPTLFVGTGTGLSPLRSMLSEVLATVEHPPLALLLGARTQADILWRAELEGWAARDAGFRFSVTLSQPDAAWQGRVGYVQAHVAEHVRALCAPHVFVCGLQRMVGEVRALCKGELGLDRKLLHSERYD